ncbi:hypothetical protein BofuT4_P132040.1 [Botrytis cinerea T4]|uniref:Uncharacterized protein n=1 Tax=Botryotinia fuckeliana (strain T4) TaxID=999810 RepID=G2YQX6_BOTF4|nr:hypothetical protein BofuT4_P132040.1 [Botrytis cinerea T4]
MLIDADRESPPAAVGVGRKSARLPSSFARCWLTCLETAVAVFVRPFVVCKNGKSMPRSFLETTTQSQLKPSRPMPPSYLTSNLTDLNKDPCMILPRPLLFP